MTQAKTAPDGAALQTAKNAFALNWSLAAHLQSLPFETLGDYQSEFAAITIERALALAWADVAERYKFGAEDIIASGLFILGLGKLGGQDLNFSSDVDLIGFYDPERLPIPKRLGQAHICGKILQAMTQILYPRNAADFIWRVDWRLRPESSGTGLAMSTRNAENFYFTRALPWHRLALMKARVIAGDQLAGAAFLKTLTPFIWRQNLDFRALDDLADLKSRINLEHPALQKEREKPQPITEDISGFNVKLGSGGIREIEFIVNAQQLIWGGKKYNLRTPNTLAALTQLSALGHMSAEDSEQLIAIYKSLRRLENAIQMIGNEQTHIVPEQTEKIASLCALLKLDNWDAYQSKIFTSRQRVNDMFTKLFEARSEKRGDAAISLNGLDDNCTSIAQSWINGFDNHGLGGTRKASLRGLGHELVQRVLNSKTEPSTSFQHIDIFLQNLSRSEQYLHLLSRNQGLLDALITPLLYSPHMTSLLKQSPHIIDVFLSAQSYVHRGNLPYTPDMSFVMAEPDYETQLERLRRFVNEHLFQYYHEFMRGADKLSAVQKNLTELAECTIETALDIVRQDLNLPALPMSVLGLGKMGTQRMAPLSDIDLVFIFEDDFDSELSAKVVRRLRTVLTAKLREGIAYDLDMRLRPSGRSGPPAVKLSAFKKHHSERAKNWEHIALAHGRVVAGDPKLGKKVEAERARIISRARDTAQFKTDAALMWSRIEQQRIDKTAPDIFNAKLREGGLMQAEYLDACQIVLGQSKTGSAKTGPDRTGKAAIDFFSHQQIWERLLGLTGNSFETIPNQFKAAIFGGASQADYLKTLSAHQSATLQTMNALFDGITIADDYDEAPINWIKP